MATDAQHLMERERYFRDHRSEIAAGDAAVLDELDARFSPTLTRDELILNAKSMDEGEAARDDSVYTVYGSLSPNEIVQLVNQHHDAGRAALVRELRIIDDRHEALGELAQQLSSRRSEVALALIETGLSQVEVAELLGVSRQRAYLIVNRARAEREARQ